MSRISRSPLFPLFFSQCRGGHRPEGGVFPSGRERHVHPNGPAGHRTGQIDPRAAYLEQSVTPF